jgi:hypothetical protein
MQVTRVAIRLPREGPIRTRSVENRVAETYQ